MNRRYSALAASVLALGAAAVTATEASARVDPQPSSNVTPLCNYPNHPACVVEPAADSGNLTPAQSPPEDNATGVLRVGASSLGGAGLALGGLWLYRRRHLSAV
jgi:hypothetical protein